MGLDWFVLPKMENGREVMPEETAGQIVLDRKDPKSIELFKQLYEEKREKFPVPGPPPVEPAGPRGFALMTDWISGRAGLRRDEHDRAVRRWRYQKKSHEYWNRSLEIVLEDALSEIEDPLAEREWILRHAADDRQHALARFLGTGGPYDFRPNELREDLNCVSVFASRELGYDYPLFIAGDLTPDEMLQMAEDMETTLQKFVDSGAELEDEDVQFGVEITESAVRYLRFWGRNGHGLQADW